MSARAAWGVMLGVLFLLVFVAVTAPGIALLPSTPSVTTVGAALWKGRTLEVILQGGIILAGVISILLLLGSERSKEMQP